MAAEKIKIAFVGSYYISIGYQWEAIQNMGRGTLWLVLSLLPSLHTQAHAHTRTHGKPLHVIIIIFYPSLLRNSHSGHTSCQGGKKPNKEKTGSSTANCNENSLTKLLCKKYRWIHSTSRESLRLKEKRYLWGTQQLSVAS